VISKRFKFDTIGHSYRITELEAALGVAQLEDWEDMIDVRRLNAEFLTESLDHLQDYIKLPSVLEDVSHSWMMYPIVVRDDTKWGLVNWLESNGVETREMLPLTNQPCYGGMINEEDYPVAMWINESGFYIGCHQDLSQHDLNEIVAAIDEYFSN